LYTVYKEEIGVKEKSGKKDGRIRFGATFRKRLRKGPHWELRTLSQWSLGGKTPCIVDLVFIGIAWNT
jgi:hypothetical protein